MDGNQISESSWNGMCLAGNLLNYQRKMCKSQIVKELTQRDKPIQILQTDIHAVPNVYLILDGYLWMQSIQDTNAKKTHRI